MSGFVFTLFIMLVKVIGTFAFLLVTTLFVIYLERKVVALMQTRVGPNRVGPFGLLQSLADGMKLFFKEDMRPSRADKVLYGLAPVVILIPAFLSATVIPFGTSFGAQRAQITDLNVGVLFLLAMASLSVYGIVLAGWASGSSYPLLGAIRSAAQMISYEIAQGLSLVGVFMYAGSLSMSEIVAAQQGTVLGFLPKWYVIPQFPMFVVFVLAGVAETNRAPFDLAEAESELVGGFHTEYSGIRFALFFLAEYVSMVTVAAVATTLFLGGPSGPRFGFLPWLWPIVWFVVKVYLFLFFFMWLRATLPRVRYDRLMTFGWKTLIPVALTWIAFTAVVLTVQIDRKVLVIGIVVLVAVLLVSLFFPQRSATEPVPTESVPTEPVSTKSVRGGARR